MALNEQQFEELRARLEISKAKSQPAQSTSQELKSGAIGAGKGLLGGAVSTAKLLQRTGQRVLGAISPSKTYDQLKTESDQGAINYPMVEKMLESKNPAEAAGKRLEFIAELLYPVGRTTEVASLGNKVKKIVGANFDNIGQRVGGIADDVVEGGVKIKDQIVDSLTKLTDKEKSALGRTPKEVFDSFVKMGKESMLDDRNPSLLEKVGESLASGLKQVRTQAQEIGAKKTEFLKNAEVGLRKVEGAVDQTLNEIIKKFSGIRLDGKDRRLVNQFYNTIESLGNSPTLREVDKVIDLLQDTIYKKTSGLTVEVTDRVTGRLREVVGKLNSLAKKAGGEEYVKYNDQYAQMIKFISDLNKRLGKDGSSAGALIKRLFSPSDANTKKLFSELQKYTGVDYFRDSRLAKFIMDAIGDKRAESLLEQIPKIPTTSRGVIDRVIDYGAKKLTDPLKAAEKYLKR